MTSRVEVARAAVEDLHRLTAVLSLPGDTTERVRAAIEPLREFPRLGPELSGRWTGTRFVLGPWRWMLIVYESDAHADRVVVLTIRDSRSSSAVTSG